MLAARKGKTAHPSGVRCFMGAVLAPDTIAVLMAATAVLQRVAVVKTGERQQQSLGHLLSAGAALMVQQPYTNALSINQIDFFAVTCRPGYSILQKTFSLVPCDS